MFALLGNLWTRYNGRCAPDAIMVEWANVLSSFVLSSLYQSDYLDYTSNSIYQYICIGKIPRGTLHCSDSSISTYTYVELRERAENTSAIVSCAIISTYISFFLLGPELVVHTEYILWCGVNFRELKSRGLEHFGEACEKLACTNISLKILIRTPDEWTRAIFRLAIYI